MKYYIWILGCAMNYSDAERLMGILDSLGYQKTTKESEADIVFTIACSVRQSAINRIYGKVKDWQKIKKRRPLTLALSGCVLEKDRKKMSKVFDYIFDIKDLSSLPGLLGINKNFKFQISNFEKDYFGVKPEYQSTFRAFVPISTGCNNFCSYCAVPYTRGREKSRTSRDIIKEVTGLVKSGYKEITLLGQNVNSYGQDLNQNSNSQNQNYNSEFVNLLKKIDKIPGDYRVYFYSNHPKDMSTELIEALPGLKHFPQYIHLPLQSGNDEVISKMNRRYTKKAYLDLVAKIRKIMPDVVLTTDVIVGFPGETKEQFSDTVDVMEIAQFDMAFLAQYSERPGTAAAKLKDDVSKEEKREREDILQKVLEKTALSNNQKLIGQTLRVLFDGEKAGKLYGRTDGYKVVEISSTALTTNKTDRKKLIGQFGLVKIESATAWKLCGSLL